jgi:hypothetical protein
VPQGQSCQVRLFHIMFHNSVFPPHTPDAELSGWPVRSVREDHQPKLQTRAIMAETKSLFLQTWCTLLRFLCLQNLLCQRASGESNRKKHAEIWVIVRSHCRQYLFAFKHEIN